MNTIRAELENMIDNGGLGRVFRFKAALEALPAGKRPDNYDGVMAELESISQEARDADARWDTVNS